MLKRMLTTLSFAAVLVLVSPQGATASCSAPQTQVSPDYGVTVKPGCSVTVAVPGDSWAVDVDVSTLRLEWSGGTIPFALSTPSQYTVQQAEAFINPKTCEEYYETWDIEFLVYHLTPDQPLPLDTEIRVLAGEAVLADFRVSDSSTYCAQLTPTVGMCGSGAPAPVEGCGPDAGSPTDELAEATGCSAAPHRETPPDPPFLAALLAGCLMLLLRGRR